MDAKETRKSLVKQLRAYARLYGSTQVRDDCGRAKVAEMFKNICKKATPAQKAEAQKMCRETTLNIHLTVPKVQ